MPYATLTPCRRPGCPNRANGFCRACRAQRNRAYNASRGTTTAQGYGAAHRALRAQVVAETGNRCENCGEPPRVGDLLELDHIIALKDGGTTTRDNVRLLHKSEHSRKTALVDRRWG